MLLLSTMVIAPVSLTANAAGQHSITINHIFSDGYNAANSYDELYGSYEEGDTPNVLINAPYGYIIDRVYFTTPAGYDFAVFIEDLAYDNPVEGVYHITMPDYDLTMNVVYRCILNSAVVNHVYDGGHYDDEDYQVVISDEQIEGSTVLFSADVKDGYALESIYVMGYTGAAFVTMYDLANLQFVDYGTGTYSIEMPDEPITINLVYSCNRHDITPVALFDGVEGVGTNYYVGPATADPGETVVFYAADVDDYAKPEIYVTTGAGQDFIEVIPYEEASGAYYFVMPDAAVTVNILYSNTRYGIVVGNIFEDGTDDDTVYYDGPDTACIGQRVFFTVNAPEGYAVKEIYGIFTAGGAFVEVFPVDSLAGAYYFDMPDGDVTLSIVYTATLFDVNFTSYKVAELDQQWKVEDVAAGSIYAFSVDVPEGYAIDDVFAMTSVGSTFVEIVPVTSIGNGSYTIEMPEADVDIIIVYKSTLFDVNFASYDGTDLMDEWVVDDVQAGDKYIFTVDAPAGYVVEDVIATTIVNNLFIEVLNVENLAGAYFFTMPEADVDVTVVLRKVTFSFTVNDVFEGQTIATAQSTADVGVEVIFIAEAPAGYENGYAVKDITVTSASDPDVAYNFANISGDVYSVIMPEDDVVINIEWKNTRHSVTVSSIDENGDLIETKTADSVNEGDVVVATMALSDNYKDDYEFVEYFAVVEVAPFHEMLDVNEADGTLTFVMPDGDVDITVVWRKVAFTVTERYIENETEVIDSLTATWDVKAGDHWISLATIPEGYEISEVYVTAIDGAFAEFVDFIYLNENSIYFEIPYGDVFVDYYVKKIVNTVSYYAYIDGELTLMNAEEVVYGEAASWGASNAADDLPDGHAFVAWYLGGEAYDFASEVKGDLDLIAVYEFVNFNVTFNSDGGSEVPAQVVIKDGKAVEPVAPEKEGYDFAGWQLNGAAYDFDSAVTADIELTATWTEKTFEVTLPVGDKFEIKTSEGFDTTVAYGGSYSFTVDYADDVDVDNAVVYANGQALVADANGVYTVSDIKSDVYISVSVPSLIEPVFYTVKFNYKHGDDDVSVSLRVEEGGSVTAPADTARYTYNFHGWYDNAEGTGEAVTDFTNITADAEYFAVYEQNPVADYSFGDHTVTDSAYGIGFKEVKIEVVKSNAEYQDRDVYVIAAAQLKDGSTVLFYVPVYVEKGEANADVALILNSNTFVYVDMYIVYDEVDLSGSLNWIDIESGIQIA